MYLKPKISRHLQLKGDENWISTKDFRTVSGVPETRNVKPLTTQDSSNLYNQETIPDTRISTLAHDREVDEQHEAERNQPLGDRGYEEAAGITQVYEVLEWRWLDISKKQMAPAIIC